MKSDLNSGMTPCKTCKKKFFHKRDAERHEMKCEKSKYGKNGKKNIRHQEDTESPLPAKAEASTKKAKLIVPTKLKMDWT